MKKATLDSLIFVLSYTLSELIVFTHTTDLTQDDVVEVSLEDGKLRVRKGEETLTQADLAIVK